MELKVIIAVFSAIFRFTSNNVCWEPGDDHNEKRYLKECDRPARSPASDRLGMSPYLRRISCDPENHNNALST